ncbi:MAG: SAM-dependent chlorinase/fluorinase [Anaerolineae bacterium]|nr:SAM-dependent chlorinase/fluorinase [Anaerolineae bacterium]
MTIITLTTDFGLSDGYVGIMKGVILGIAADVQLVDISHDITPQDVRQGSFVLRNAVSYFPAGTVHLAVVDPGVGSSRRPLLVTTPRASFVGPDNGLFTFALEQPGAQAWVLDQPRYWLPAISRTFHGRDIFAPVVAHLARGVPPEELGSPVSDAVQLEPLLPERLGNHHIVGHVIHVDRFGNLITNVPASWLADGDWACEIAGRRIPRLSETYSAALPGELLALIGSSGMLEVAVRNGSAARLLEAGVGQAIHLRKG